jgi:undecaprenyl-diphosphatase
MDYPLEPQPPAETLAQLRNPSAGDSDTNLDRILRELGQLDRAVYAAIADSPTPSIDEPLRRLSNAANLSKL